MRFLTWHYLQYVSNESALLISEICATYTIIVVSKIYKAWEILQIHTNAPL